MALFGELFLSDILGKPVLDPKGEELGRLKDITVVKGEPLPKIDTLLLESKKRMVKLQWSDLNLFNRKVMTSMNFINTMQTYEPAEDDLLAVRDILDKQIVDANGARVVRVNDIKIEGYFDTAVLVAVDVGIRGLLRRMGIERQGEMVLRLLRREMPQSLISWNYIQPLQPKLTNISLTVTRQIVADLHPADLAEMISQISPQESAHLIRNLDVETAADAISELDPKDQQSVISDIEASRAADILEEMPPDSAADLLSSLSAEKAQELLGHIEQEEAEDIQELLGHDADTAGGLMTNVYVAYPPEMTVADAILKFKTDAEDIHDIYYIYVIDEDEKLRGVTSLREILLASPEATLGDIMETNIKSVRPETDEDEVAGVIAKYNLVALPVVDCDTCMVGVVTVDDILDRLIPKKARKLMRSV